MCEIDTEDLPIGCLNVHLVECEIPPPRPDAHYRKRNNHSFCYHTPEELALAREERLEQKRNYMKMKRLENSYREQELIYKKGWEANHRDTVNTYMRNYMKRKRLELKKGAEVSSQEKGVSTEMPVEPSLGTL